MTAWLNDPARPDVLDEVTRREVMAAVRQDPSPGHLDNDGFFEAVRNGFVSRTSQLERLGISREVYEEEQRRMAEEERIIRASMEPRPLPSRNMYTNQAVMAMMQSGTRTINGHQYEETTGEPTTDVQFTLPNMRLPRPHKVAFRAAELFAQQRDLTKFDYGLQAVLDALCVAVNSVRPDSGHTPLHDMDFTINFSGAVSTTRKRFSVTMRNPAIGSFELVQAVTENMTSTWELIIDGRSFNFGRPVGQTTVTLNEIPREPEPVAVQNDHPTRESRVLDLDL